MSCDTCTAVLGEHEWDEVTQVHGFGGGASTGVQIERFAVGVCIQDSSHIPTRTNVQCVRDSTYNTCAVQYLYIYHTCGRRRFLSSRNGGVSVQSRIQSSASSHHQFSGSQIALHNEHKLTHSIQDSYMQILLQSDSLMSFS